MHATRLDAQGGGVPEKLRELLRPLRIDAWQDLVWSLGILAAAGLVGFVIAVLVVRSLARWARHTDSVIDDCVAKHVPRPVKLLLPTMAVALALPVVALPPGLIAGLRHVTVVLVIVGLGWLIFRTVRVVEDVAHHRFDKRDADDLHTRAVHTQLRAFANIAGFVVSVVTVAFALLTFEAVRELGAGLLASAGLAGIVLGFAAQRSLATLLAGIQIAIAQPIRVQDVVVLEGEWGRIEEIKLTYVVVRLWDLRRLIVPINYFMEKPFQNWTRVSPEIIGTVNLYVDYGVPVEAIRNELERLLESSPLWNKNTWNVQVTDATDRSVVVRLLMSAKDASDAFNLRCEVREKLITFLQQNYPEALPRVRADVDGLAA